MTTERPLTCLSCANYRHSGCAQRMPAWPDERLAYCCVASYLPGADEREDWDAHE